jgi:hypothetical protein
VAASVATLFYEGMVGGGVAGGEAMRGLVFLVITCTVLVQGLTGSLVAGWLGVKRPRGQGYVILGANPVAVELARALKLGGEESVLIDAIPLCAAKWGEGFRVLHETLDRHHAAGDRDAQGDLAPSQRRDLLCAPRGRRPRGPRLVDARRRQAGAYPKSRAYSLRLGSGCRPVGDRLGAAKQSGTMVVRGRPR